MKNSLQSRAVVFVVDDDDSVRSALTALLETVDLTVEGYASAHEFLAAELPDAPSCVVLDVRLPGASGLNVQEELAKAGINIPVIFVTGHGDIPMTVQAMKAGAVEFLTKPFRDQEILDAVQLALERDTARRARTASHADLKSRFESLTQREREVMVLVVSGLMNKQIAADLSLAEITVKIHRGNVNRKMGTRSIADLVKAAQALGLQVGNSKHHP